MLDETKDSPTPTHASPGGGGGKDGRPSPIDVHVGTRIRLRRTLLAMSQERLGDALGLTFQQVQKYERGLNRVGASRLFDLSRVLDVPVSFFFDDMRETATGPNSAASDVQDLFVDDTMSRRDTLELVRAYYRIPDPALRQKMSELVKSMGPAHG
jgi:transcriptional regulator with XRE-family HTH domain